MNDRLWKNFENTGSIEAYLAYRNVSLKEEYNCHGENSSNGNCAFRDTHR